MDCPNCGGTGYDTKPVDPYGKHESVALIRFPCPVCAGTGKSLEVLPEKGMKFLNHSHRP